MVRPLLLFLLILFSGMSDTVAIQPESNASYQDEMNNDSLRLAELDIFWEELSRTVYEGDHEGYESMYHDDAVVVFASGTKKFSMSISAAMKGWEQGFKDTKSGKHKDQAEFRFSQRIGNEVTAHETGIFIFTSADGEGNVLGRYITHFEMLLVKRDGKWLAVMEHQRSDATEEEWDSLQGD